MGRMCGGLPLPDGVPSILQSREKGNVIYPIINRLLYTTNLYGGDDRRALDNGGGGLPMNTNRPFSIILASALLFTWGCVTDTSHLVAVKKDNLSYQGQRISIGDIEGYPEAVALLKGSLANALMGIYAPPGEPSDYHFVGSLYAKRHWRKRLYIFYTVNLRIVDNNGNILAAINSQKAFWQINLDDFSTQVVNAIR